MPVNTKFSFDNDAKLQAEIGAALLNAYLSMDMDHTQSNSHSPFESVTDTSYYKHWVRHV